jgi:hypothetical protein
MIRICLSNRPTDPNGTITRFALRVGESVHVWPTDDPSWRSLAAYVVQTLHRAGVPIAPVRAGGPGRPARLLLGDRAAWEGERGSNELVEGTRLRLREKPMNPHAYLLVIFGVLPTDYTDEDFWVEYEPVFRRPRQHNRRGRADADDPDEESLFLPGT